MKLLIDIPEHIYEHAKETTEDSNDEFDAMRAIANGTQQESRSEIPNTCGDAVSRAIVQEEITKSIELKENPYQLWYRIQALPSVTPQPCGDAISREAAIMAMKRLEEEDIERYGCSIPEGFDGRTAIETLQTLPSVTPQQRKTQMLDESNFDVNQYEMDLRSAYDCGRASTQQRTGRWIKQNYGWNWQCSECGFVTPPSAKEIFTFCPNCGAKMEVDS